jgi:small subunit ribosomal protein S7
MSEKTKVAVAETASKNPAKKAVVDKKKTTPKKSKFNNPFSYDDPIQQKLVNCIMKNGKKTVAQRILRDTFTEMNRRGEKDVFKTFEKAFENATPTMEVKPKRIGGGVYQIPMEVKPKRQSSLSTRWILAGARKKKGQPMYKRLASELMDCASEMGFAYTKKIEAHKAAQANKAFAHLARY